MKLKKIKYKTTKPADECVALPSKITVEMSLEEAIWICTVAGESRGISAHNDIYGCLTFDVFDRVWDDGLTDARALFPVVTPPIRYD